MYTAKDFKPGMIVQYLNICKEIDGIYCIVLSVSEHTVWVRRHMWLDDIRHDRRCFDLPKTEREIKIIQE